MGETTCEEEGARPEVSMEWRERSVSCGEKNTGGEEERNFVQTGQATVPKKNEKRSFSGDDNAIVRPFCGDLPGQKTKVAPFFHPEGPGSGGGCPRRFSHKGRELVANIIR